MQKLVFILGLLILAALAGVVRFWNVREVFIEGRVYFADGDCYSRMTRARTIADGHGWIIRHHDFENYPTGITPHTTAPLDWVIVLGEKLAGLVIRCADPTAQSIFCKQGLDVAGALVGPALAALACIGVGIALPKGQRGERWQVLSAVAMLAISPIVVHGTALGRPDHQALLIALLAFAVAAEVRLWRAESRAWSIAAGVAWGGALWVSLYEPVVLLFLTFLGIGMGGRAFFDRNRWEEWGTILGIVVLAALVDGWRIEWPDANSRAAFGRWSTSIYELRPLDLRSGVLWQWLGTFCFLVPVGLAWRWRASRESRLLLVLLVGTLALTLWQLRWGYFLAVVFALSLPCAMQAVRWPWLGGVLYFASFWSIASAWETQLFPNEVEERRRFAVRTEQVALRNIAEQQRERAAGPFLAPWWLSPALAYWSGQPGVGGTSHESLPGIIDSARVFLAPDFGAAKPILQAHQVKWIVADDPKRIVPLSAALLGEPVPEHSLADDLATQALPAPYTLSLIPEHVPRQTFGSDFFHVWRVR